MTREVQQTKNYFRINGGLNSEINELNFPDGFTRDEANYELLVDGSRRRRKGLATESGASAAHTVAAWTSSVMSQVYLWRDAGGLTDTDIMVYRQGNELHFATADSVISDGWFTQAISLVSFETTGSTTANTDDIAISFSQGRGYLFVSGPFLKSFYVEYDGSTAFATSEITIKIRDYIGIEDGISVAEEPTGTITADHRYNLRNRGWSQTEMDTYDTDKSKHPSKKAIWFRGFKRTYGASIAEQDGQRSWDSDKLENEAFGSSSAPIGSLFLEPHDTTIGYGVGGAGGVFGISTWSHADATSTTWTITVTTDAAHGLSSGAEFTIDGNLSWYRYELHPGEPEITKWDFNGGHTAVAGTTGSTLKFVVDQPPFWDQSGAWISQYLQYGSVDADQSLDRSNGTAHTDSNRAIEFHAGRVFYGGMKNQEFADYIFFSQIADTPAKFGRCHQEADPTDENYNALVGSDGGYIVIPGMSGVVNMLTVRNSLIIFANEGIWEVAGGQRGFFTPDGYLVRKLSDQGCNAALGMTQLEDSAIYTGPGGVFIVSPNQYTGMLEVNSISEQTIQSIWNQLSAAVQERMAVAYDSSLRRLYLMYGHDGTQVGIETMLIFDARAGAWFKYTFDSPADNELLCGFALPSVGDASNNQKMKFLFKSTSTAVQIGDFVQTSFDDWDGTNGPLPFLTFGHDMMGEAQRRGQAPIITVFSKRTETGYTSTGGGWNPVNDSSTLMTAQWDWSENPVTDANIAITNKIGAQQQVYRHVRQFVPSAADDVDGYPVIVTRNKVRGRGRALQLRFDGAADKDSYILGFTTNIKITRKK